MSDTEPAQRDAYANFQFEIYAQGLAGQTPALAITARDLEASARERLTPEAFGYVAGGAGSERTMGANLRAFERWEIVPRMLRDVSDRDLGVSVLGTAMPAPVLLAPIGVQSIVHPEAELAVGRAAAAHGLPAILSTAASHTMEDVAAAMDTDPAHPASRWYQLYWPRDRDLAESFVARAADAGYEALVVTLDTWLLGWRPRDLANAYLPFLKGEGVANYFSDPVFRGALARPPEEDPAPAIGHWAYQFANPRVTWADLEWLRGQTSMPIVLKGVLHAEDARRAVEAGMDGLIVSNHGGRQVDGSIGALDALPGVRAIVGEDFPVLFDSGIRTGADVFKALALGADAVCLGRPYVWGLGLDGQAGVEHVLRCLLAELDLTLALSGYTEIAQVDDSALRRAD